MNIAIDRKTGVRRAVKTMVKRFGPGGALEANFVRRVQHEVRSVVAGSGIGYRVRLWLRDGVSWSKTGSA